MIHLYDKVFFQSKLSVFYVPGTVLDIGNLIRNKMQSLLSRDWWEIIIYKAFIYVYMYNLLWFLQKSLEVVMKRQRLREFQELPKVDNKSQSIQTEVFWWQSSWYIHKD